MHANYIGPNETEVKGEAEMLLPPYSGLQVKCPQRWLKCPQR